MGEVNVQSEQGRGKGKKTGGWEVILEEPLQMDRFTLADLRMDPQLTLNHLGY